MTAGPGISHDRYRQRLEGVSDRLGQKSEVLLVGVGPDLRWLTGYAAMPLERLTMLLLRADERPVLVVPRLERAAAAAAPAVAAEHVEVVTWEETEDPIALVAQTLGSLGDRRPLVSDLLPATFVLGLQQAGVLRSGEFGLASRILAPLRSVKDPEEVALLREAALAADRVIEAICDGPLVGRKERDVAQEIRARLVNEGHDEASFSIVGSGPNSASPHHDASERFIGAGEPVVFDIGGTLGGYVSDITRTIWVAGTGANGPDPQFEEIYQLVRDAQERAVEAVAPGIACERLDRTARAIIADGGYGERFIHRTGHGIGLEGHEDPYIVAGNQEALPVGAAFSVEPGIYLEGRYGVRIEDIVVCTPGGPDLLNQAPRELLVVGGV